jgi:hypothetical protein
MTVDELCARIARNGDVTVSLDYNGLCLAVYRDAKTWGKAKILVDCSNPQWPVDALLMHEYTHHVRYHYQGYTFSEYLCNRWREEQLVDAASRIALFCITGRYDSWNAEKYIEICTERAAVSGGTVPQFSTDEAEELADAVLQHLGFTSHKE